MTRTIGALAAALLLTVAGPSLARDDATLRTAAEAFVGGPLIQQTLDRLPDVMSSGIAAGVRAGGRNLSHDRMETLARIVSEEFQRSRPRFEALLAKAVAETLSLEEIRQITEPFDDATSVADVKVSIARAMKAFRTGAVPLMEQMSRRVKARARAELRR